MRLYLIMTALAGAFAFNLAGEELPAPEKTDVSPAKETKEVKETKEDVEDPSKKARLTGVLKLRKKGEADDTITPAEIEKLKARAESGDAVAQYRLGLRYAKGQGVPQNEVEACKWLELSGDVQFLSTLKAHMTTEEIVDGKRSARQFMERYGKSQ